MRAVRLGSIVTTAFVALAVSRASAQAPLPDDLPWNEAPAAVRARLQARGMTVVSGSASDSAMVFRSTRAGGSATLTARFTEGRLWHVFYVAQGDSAALQRELDETAAAMTRLRGQPANGANGARTWVTADTRRRFSLPAAPMKSPEGTFLYAVTYHRD